MNKNKKDYLYNPKPFRRVRDPACPPPPTPWPDSPPVKTGNAGFIIGLMVGFMLGFILAKWL